MPKVLCVLTSTTKLPDETSTGFDLAEVAHTRIRWANAGIEVVFASVTGEAAVDPATVEEATTNTDSVSTDFSKDEALMAACTAPKKLADVLADEEAPLAATYAAVYVAGGYGAMYDLAEAEDVKTVIKTMYEAEKVVCAIEHGTIALVGVEGLLADKECTGSSLEEEEKAGKAELVGALATKSCEESMGAAPEGYEGDFKYAGGLYKSGPAGQPNVCTAGKLITGQNKESADALATAVLYAIDEVIAEFEPPRDALLAERADLVTEITGAADSFTVALNALKGDEAANAGKIEELQLKSVAKRDWQYGKLSDVDAKLARLANERAKKVEKLAAEAAAAAEE